MPRVPVLIALTGLAASTSAARAQPPSFDLVGVAPGGTGSFVYGLSADGSIAAGQTSGLITGPGFLWSRTQGRYDFGLESGMPLISGAFALSADGTVVAGTGGTTSALRAFRWHGTGTYQSLGVLPPFAKSFGEGISGDGSVVVGRCEDSSGFNARAFRWTQAGGMQGLPTTRPTIIYGTATAISRDGSTIVGYNYDAGGFRDAFVWTLAAGILALPQLPGTPVPLSAATAVNPDGTIVVGVSGPNSTSTMWRNGQPADLGSAPGFPGSDAFGVDDLGTIVVGDLRDPMGNLVAGVWTASHGMEPLSLYLAGMGVTVTPGWTLVSASAVSGDGLTISGWARSATQVQGFVAYVPTPATFLVLTGGILAASRRRRCPRRSAGKANKKFEKGYSAQLGVNA